MTLERNTNEDFGYLIGILNYPAAPWKHEMVEAAVGAVLAHGGTTPGEWGEGTRRRVRAILRRASVRLAVDVPAVQPEDGWRLFSYPDASIGCIRRFDNDLIGCVLPVLRPCGNEVWVAFAGGERLQATLFDPYFSLYAWGMTAGEEHVQFSPPE
jgi:hypothetical protein